MKFTEAQAVEYDGYFDPDGQAVTGFVTQRLAGGDIFGDAVCALILAETGRTYGLAGGEVLMTTRHHWSGYSEYTITNQWSEIILTVPKWNWEREWASLGDFLRAVADANPEADR